ncbi:MAG: hypothetical protein IJJ00_07180 [Erysipelotrichaceae bacterium]|nr:hypothetical protein [Erysipelotrichaceae bacterium]
MNVLISIKDLNEGYADTVEVRDISDISRFSYLDSEGCLCVMEVVDDGISLSREASDHRTEAVLKEGGYLKITGPEGTFKFSLKAIEISRNNDIITVVYSIDSVTKCIEIKYIGV